MPRIPVSWLGDHVTLREGATAESIAADLVSVGLEEEAIHGAQVTGPLVVGRVLDLVKEPQKNGKTINWCRVDVGEQHNEAHDDPKDPQPGDERPSRGIICGAHNFDVGDLVVVSLPGTVLPGDFAIAARKTYGHTSDGMICSGDELGLGPDPDGEDGIIVLGRGHGIGLENAEPGDDAISLLGLGEEVVEINVTPDRGYCFSMRGVAREYSHATGGDFTDPVAAVTAPAGTRGGVPVQIQDETPIRGGQGCTRFVAMEVRGVDPSAPTPGWMQRRLTLAGMRPISLIVDVTNYVMLDLGQPLHAYDSYKVVAPIVVRRAHPGEKLTTLDDVERTLDPEDLLITDFGGIDGSSRVLGIAGVMGGASTEVSSETVNIILEAATFQSFTVARSARRHRLPSEAAKRFERGVDPQLPLVAAQRAAELIVQYGGGDIDPRVSDEGAVNAPQTITFPIDAAQRVTGVEYTREQIVETLEMIGCDIAASGDPGNAGTGESAAEELHVTVPSWRTDLTIPEDLVEEIARLVGYERIPSVLPKAPGGRGLTRIQRARRAVSRALAEAGAHEVASLPFIAPTVFDQLGYAEDDERRHAVRLLNPLAEDEPLMRTELLQTVLATARRNLGRGAESLAIFQLDHVWRSRGNASISAVPSAQQRPDAEQLAAIMEPLPEQSERVAVLLAGASGPASWFGQSREWDWADALEFAQRIAAAVPADLQVKQAEHAPFHPGRCAKLSVIGADGSATTVGYAGELHPRVSKEFSLPARSSAVELDLGLLVAAAPEVIAAAPVSTYPLAKEDFAFIVDESVPASAVEAAIVLGIGDLAESVRLFDVYTGDQIDEGKKSLAFAVRLRSQDGTLSAEDIAAARKQCIDTVERAVGGQLRG